MSERGNVAAVDCGTNSTRLLIAGPNGGTRKREMRITRLGEGVDATRVLETSAVRRTLDVLRDFRSAMDAEEVARARLVATSAVRDATNGDAFLRAAAEVIGVTAELLPGQEEGRLSYTGATAELPDTEAGYVVLDIGGGSTEVVARSRGDIVCVSMDIGCVRLTERYLRGDPPSASDAAAAVAAINGALDGAVRAVPELETEPIARLVGLAGTVSALASLELGLEHYDRDRIHHAVLPSPSVGRWRTVLGSERVADRARRAALPDGRQDVIFGGVLVLDEVMKRFGFAECTVSEADILDGLVMSILPASAQRGPTRRPV